MSNANPYKPTLNQTNAIPTNSLAEKHIDLHRPVLTLVIATIFVATVLLAQYLALDYFIVRVRPYPAEANAYNWTLFLFPLLPLISLIAVGRTSRFALEPRTIVAAMLLGSLCSLPLIVIIGICWFHFAIGGTL